MPIPDPVDLSRAEEPSNHAVSGKHLGEGRGRIEMIGANQGFGGGTQIIGEGSGGIRHPLTVSRRGNPV